MERCNEIYEGWGDGETHLRVPYAAESDSEFLNLYVLSNVENPPLFVLIHGGGLIAGEAETRQTLLMIDYFRNRGYTCASVNYRLAQETAFPDAIYECKAAILFLSENAGEYGYSTDRVAVFRESAGGYLVIMCAMITNEDFHGVAFIGQGVENVPSARVDVLVDYYGYTSLTGLAEDRVFGVNPCRH